jgi:serine/threonine protein kinase
MCGTPNYTASEVLFDTDNGHSFEVDTRSIGVILYTLIMGNPPFQTKDVKAIDKCTRNNQYEFPQDIPISPNAENLISSMFTSDPRERRSFCRRFFPEAISLQNNVLPFGMSWNTRSSPTALSPQSYQVQHMTRPPTSVTLPQCFSFQFCKPQEVCSY